MGSEIQKPEFSDYIEVVDGEPTMTSLSIAEIGGKRHGDVIRQIEQVTELDEEFSRRNFASAEYTDAQGKTRKSYRCTEAGALYLVAGWTGDLGHTTRKMVIEGFQAWRAAQQSNVLPGPGVPMPTNLDDLGSSIERMINAAVAGEVRKQVAEETKAYQERIDELDEAARNRDREHAKMIDGVTSQYRAYEGFIRARIDDTLKGVNMLAGFTSKVSQGLVESDEGVPSALPYDGPSDWSGGHRSSVSILLSDFMIVYFKTVDDAKKWHHEMRITEIVPAGRQQDSFDFSTRQTESGAPACSRPNAMYETRGFLFYDKEKNRVMVTPRGRGFFEARLAFVRESYDLRPESESLMVKGMVIGRKGYSDFVELQDAFRQNRRPNLSRFTGPKQQKKLEGER